MVSKVVDMSKDKRDLLMTYCCDELVIEGQMYSFNREMHIM